MSHSYPQFIVKKFPFVLRDKTDWAIEAVPNATKTKVPAKRRKIKCYFIFYFIL